jgi:SnoaL-like domain
MSENSPALKIALAYFEAWKNLDHTEGAMKYVADGIVNETPFGTTEGADALRDGEAGFAQMLTGATMVAAYGDETTALLMYYTHTHPAPNVLSAKYFVVEDGKIVSMKALFDKGVFGQGN